MGRTVSALMLVTAASMTNRRASDGVVYPLSSRSFAKNRRLLCLTPEKPAAIADLLV
jgi:hypothetical protein